MIDFRMNTFLVLCKTMNYRLAAKELHITQPAVTQHIQYLEKEYDCKLFTYNNRKLLKTDSARLLEEHAHSMEYNESFIRNKLCNYKKQSLRIGATKTIGDYVITNHVINYLSKDDNTLFLTVDNTKHLLDKLENNHIDFAIIEGFFDKTKYDYNLYRNEPFVGICSKNHPFAGKAVSMNDLFLYTIIYREKGSGTRAILEQKLLEHNYSLSQFKKEICISSFSMIKELVKSDIGITFAYKAITADDDSISTFTIKNDPIIREFNYVYLKNTSASNLVDEFESATNIKSVT